MNTVHVFSALALLLPSASFNALAAGTTKEACPESVRITFLDIAVPPMYNGSGIEFANPPGYLVDWVRSAVAQTGCPVQPELVRRPVKRAYQELEHGETDILATVPNTPDRIGQGEFPRFKGEVDERMAYYVTGLSLWARKGDNTVRWDGKTLSGPAGFKVGVVQGSQAETIAQKQGWNLEGGTNGPNIIEKLLAGRMALAVAPDAVVAGLPDDIEAQLERLTPALVQTYVHSVANKAFYARYPEFMARYWSALCKASRSEKALPEQKRLQACR